MHIADLDLRDLFRMQCDGGVHRFLDARAFCFDAATFGWLRRALIERLGLTETRTVLTHLGYVWGWQTADGASQAIPWGSQESWHQAAARLAALQGMAAPEVDEKCIGELPATLTWRASLEAEQHLLHTGPTTAPVCWGLAGFLAGFCSRAANMPITCEEDTCSACGDARCRMTVRLADPRDDRVIDLTGVQTIVQRLAAIAPSSPGTDANNGERDDANDVSRLGASSPAMRRLLTEAERAAHAPSTVLITGESGVGKEYLARFIHRASPRASAPFIAVNCAAVAETLLESELFGHSRGAFTGAIQERAGLFEAAQRGTLFLDEIGEMPIGMQAKLLRVLQDKEVRRLGENRQRPIDVRVIVATNRDLTTEVAERRFRLDLFYRIRVVEFTVPPLRDRPADLRALTRTLLERLAKTLNRSVTGYTPRALERLLAYHWPGNVRELQNVIERACVLATGPLIDVPDLPEPLRVGRSLVIAPVEVRPLYEIEREYILAALDRNHGNRTQTAAQLRIGSATLLRKLKAYRTASELSPC